MNWTGGCLCGGRPVLRIKPGAGRGRMPLPKMAQLGRNWSGHVWAYVTLRWAALISPQPPRAAGVLRHLRREAVLAAGQQQPG